MSLDQKATNKMTYKEDTNFNLFDLKATCIYIENQIIALIPKSYITKVDNKKPYSFNIHPNEINNTLVM